jgi:hypothetical protein
VFADFELDLESALPQHWQQLTKGSASEASNVSPHSIKLRSRLLSLSQRSTAAKSNGISRGGGNRPGRSPHGKGQSGSNGGGCGSSGSSSGVNAALPSAWAGKLQAVVEVLELAGQERGHMCEEWGAAQQRVQLLETNVQEVGQGCAAQV